MGLFGQSCPLEKSHLEIYGIQAPRKWKVQDCIECEYLRDGKCNFKQIMANREKLIKRGRPVLVKKSVLDQPLTIRMRYEEEAVVQVGFTAEELKEYWELSRAFDRQWESETAERRQVILDSLDQWKVHLEKGDSPAKAAEKAKEWLNQRARFRQSSEGLIHQ
jgi:hypothetical protein